MTGTWGANTFTACKQLPNPYFQNAQTSFWFFKCLPWINIGGDSHAFSILEDALFIFTSSSRRRIGCDSWRLYWGPVRELGHSVSVQCFFIMTSSWFIFNTWIVRHLTQEDYAVTLLSPSSPCFTSRFLYLVLILTCIISFSLIQLYAVQFHLLVTCILFLSREGFRRACLRMDLKWWSLMLF